MSLIVGGGIVFFGKITECGVGGTSKSINCRRGGVAAKSLFLICLEGVQFATLGGGISPQSRPIFCYLFTYDISLENVLKLLKMAFAFHFKL